MVRTTLTNSVEQSPSWEANSSAASQEISRIIWNPKVHCLMSLSWATGIQSAPPHFTSWIYISIPSSHLHLCLFPADLTTKTLQAPLPYPTRATRPAYLIPFHLITRVTFGGIRSSITWRTSWKYFSPCQCQYRSCDPPSLATRENRGTSLGRDKSAAHWSSMQCWGRKRGVCTSTPEQTERSPLSRGTRQYLSW
jgi:hypothetical protein